MTAIQQLTVVMPNVPGNLATVSDKLRAANVNITAISCTEGASTSLLHIVVDDTETAKLVLQPHYKVSVSPLMVFHIKNKVGSIAAIARACAAAGLNIRYIFSTTLEKEAQVYVALDDMDKALQVFQSDGTLKHVA